MNINLIIEIRSHHDHHPRQNEEDLHKGNSVPGHVERAHVTSFPSAHACISFPCLVPNGIGLAPSAAADGGADGGSGINLTLFAADGGGDGGGAGGSGISLASGADGADGASSISLTLSAGDGGVDGGGGIVLTLSAADGGVGGCVLLREAHVSQHSTEVLKRLRHV